MNKIIKRISILLVFTLLLSSFSFSINGLANTNELDLLTNETGLSNNQLKNSLNMISDNYDLLIMDVDNELIESYDIKNKNIALLKYFIEEVESSKETPVKASANIEAESNEMQVQAVNGAIIRALLQSAKKKKMGPKIEKKIGKEVDDRFMKKAENAAVKASNKYGYGSSRGPTQANAPNRINQGEHIIELYDAFGKPYFRLHVYKNPAGNHTRWHWHERDNWTDHRGSVDVRHDTLPKWGAK
jgi:hypothetical protein